MGKFKKKPVIVEAEQFTDDRALNFVTRNCTPSRDDPTLKIQTLEGVITANLGDWIIKGVRGEFYPCKPDIFEQTYLEVSKVKYTPKYFADKFVKNQLCASDIDTTDTMLILDIHEYIKDHYGMTTAKSWFNYAIKKAG